MPIAAMPLSSSMKKPKGNWAGINIKVGCGRDFTDMR